MSQTRTVPSTASFLAVAVAPPPRKFGLAGFPWIPFAIVVALILIAILAPMLSPYGQNEGSLQSRLVPPLGTAADGSFHLLGSDWLGRDTATRIAYGARVSLVVGVVGVLIACVIGVLIGLIAGMFGRITDTVLMRLTDVALSIPGLLVAILLATVFPPSIFTVFVAIGLLLWPTYARLIRGEVLVLRNSDFVALSKVAGASRWTIMLRHLLPNVVPSILVLATMQIGTAIILEASISFLGVGLPPDQASWGSMIDGGRQYLGSAWWLTGIPGVAIFLAVLSFNALGDWTRIRFDPRLENVR